MSDMVTVWPADTSTGGISFLAADLGSGGALVRPKGFDTVESVTSEETGNCLGERRQEKILLKNVNYTFFLFLFSFSLTCLDTVKSYHGDGLGEQVQNFYLMVVGVCHIKQLPLTANADSSRFIKAGFSQFWTQGISGLSGPC